MENPLDRLSWVRERAGLNSKAFAESIGLTAAGLHNMYTRKSRVAEVLANSVEMIHGIRAQWILSGEGLRHTDHHTLLDAGEQALLECIKNSNEVNELLGEFVMRELENEIEDASIIYRRWLMRKSTKAKAKAKAKGEREEWDKYEKLRIRKEKLRTELWDVLNNLRAGDQKQIIVDPLFLAIHFKDRWEEICERSADYKQMQSFGLQADFDAAHKTINKIVKKMKGLFKLSKEQKKLLD